VASGVIYIGSGVQSYSTNDIGNNSYAFDGKSLSLADAGAVYTIDELDSDDAEIIDDNEDRTDNSSGDFGLSDSISADEHVGVGSCSVPSFLHVRTNAYCPQKRRKSTEEDHGLRDRQVWCNGGFNRSSVSSCAAWPLNDTPPESSTTQSVVQ